MATTSRLVLLDDSGTEKMSLILRSDPAMLIGDCLALSRLDLGWPTVREVTGPRISASGNYDLTTRYGNRTITADIKLLGPNKQDYLDQLAQFCAPDLRPYLYMTNPSWTTERRMLLRNSSLSLSLDSKSDAMFEVSCSWVCPSGIMESSEEFLVPLRFSAVDEGGSIYGDGAYDDGLYGAAAYTGDRYGDGAYGDNEYGPVGPTTNVGMITNDGHVTIPLRILIYGECYNPRIRLSELDMIIDFDGLSIGDGHFVDIDVDNKTVFYDGDPAQSKYSTINWADSQWLYIPKGEYEVAFDADTYANDSYAVVYYRRGWLR